MIVVNICFFLFFKIIIIVINHMTTAPPRALEEVRTSEVVETEASLASN